MTSITISQEKVLDKKSPIPRYYQISEILKEAIYLGNHKPGDALPSERTLSRFFNVSPLCVRKSLELLVEEGIIEKKWGKGSFVKKNELPFPASTKQIGLTLWRGKETLFHPGSLEILRGINHILQPAGYATSLFFISPETVQTKEYAKVFGSAKIDGLIEIIQAVPEEELAMFQSYTPHVVHANRSGSVYSVKSDMRGMTQDIVRYLVKLGHNDIALINGPASQDISQEVFTGYAIELVTHGISVNPLLVKNGPYLYETGKRLTAKLLNQKEPPTAIILGDDFMALGAMAVLKEHGISCPQEISLVSFGNFSFAPYLTPPLTTVALSTFEMGQELALMVLALIKETPVETPKITKGTLIERQSTALAPR